MYKDILDEFQFAIQRPQCLFSRKPNYESHEGDQRKQVSDRNVRLCNLFSEMSRGKIFYQPWRKKCRYQYDENNKYFEKKCLRTSFKVRRNELKVLKPLY